MAYSFTTTNNQYLEANSAVVTGVPVTISCWYYRTSVVSQSYVSISKKSSTNFLAITHGSNNFISALSNDGVNGNATQVYPDSSINTWNHACAVFYSNTLRKIFWNGINSGSGTTTSNVSGQDVTNIGVRYVGGVISSSANAQIADVGIWNVALSNEEILSLSKGITCDKIRSQNLVFYVPLVRNLQDVKGGLSITNNNGATVADHPRIYS